MSMYALCLSASRSSRSRSGKSRPNRMPRAASTLLTSSEATIVISSPALTASSKRPRAGPGTSTRKPPRSV